MPVPTFSDHKHRSRPEAAGLRTEQHSSLRDRVSGRCRRSCPRYLVKEDGRESNEEATQGLSALHPPPGQGCALASLHTQGSANPFAEGKTSELAPEKPNCGRFTTRKTPTRVERGSPQLLWTLRITWRPRPFLAAATPAVGTSDHQGSQKGCRGPSFVMCKGSTHAPRVYLPEELNQLADRAWCRTIPCTHK